MPCWTILNLCFDPACTADTNGHVLYMNEPFQELFGLADSDTQAFSLTEILGQADFTDIQKFATSDLPVFKRLKVRSRDGSFIRLEARCARVPDSGELALVLRPTTANLTLEGAEHMALHDALTGLPNRVLLLDRMNQALDRCRRHNDFAAVVFIDLDGFKPVNDTYGHDCGDAVLKTIARRLEDNMRGGDTAARIGGDEFVMLLLELKNGLHAGLTANRIIKNITQPIAWGNITVRVSASLGVSVAPTDGMEPDMLLKKADDAMYVAKKSGKNGYYFHNEAVYFE